MGLLLLKALSHLRTLAWIAGSPWQHSVRCVHAFSYLLPNLSRLGSPDDDLLHPPSLLRLDQGNPSNCRAAAQQGLETSAACLCRRCPTDAKERKWPPMACFRATRNIAGTSGGRQWQWVAKNCPRLHAGRVAGTQGGLTPITRCGLQKRHQHPPPLLLCCLPCLLLLLHLLGRCRCLHARQGQDEEVCPPASPCGCCRGCKQGTSQSQYLLVVGHKGHCWRTWPPYCCPIICCIRRWRMASSSGSSACVHAEARAA